MLTTRLLEGLNILFCLVGGVECVLFKRHALCVGSSCNTTLLVISTIYETFKPLNLYMFGSHVIFSSTYNII